MKNMTLNCKKMTPHKQGLPGQAKRAGGGKMSHLQHQTSNRIRQRNGVIGYSCSGRIMRRIAKYTNCSIWYVNHVEHQDVVIGYEVHLGRIFHPDNEDLGTKFFTFARLEDARQFAEKGLTT